MIFNINKYEKIHIVINFCYIKTYSRVRRIETNQNYQISVELEWYLEVLKNELQHGHYFVGPTYAIINDFKMNNNEFSQWLFSRDTSSNDYFISV